MPHTDPDLWTCPKCGEKFTGVNMAHSCGNFKLDRLFADSDPHVFETFRALEKMAQEVAPFHVVPQKTRFCLQLRTRCAAGTPMKSHIRFHFLSRTIIRHVRIIKVETFAKDQHVHYVKLERPEDVDGQIREWLKVSTEYGEQKK
jgi:hypothetical protein